MLSLDAVVSFSFSSYAMDKTPTQILEQQEQYIEELLSDFEYMWEYPNVKK